MSKFDSGKSIQKVWVCGPPVMSETFDRVFSAAAAANNQQVSAEENLLADLSNI